MEAFVVRKEHTTHAYTYTHIHSHAHTHTHTNTHTLPVRRTDHKRLEASASSAALSAAGIDCLSAAAASLLLLLLRRGEERTDTRARTHIRSHLTGSSLFTAAVALSEPSILVVGETPEAPATTRKTSGLCADHRLWRPVPHGGCPCTHCGAGASRSRTDIPHRPGGGWPAASNGRARETINEINLNRLNLVGR